MSTPTPTVEGAVQSWTCFHCDETFTEHQAALEHFGFEQSCDPACKIKLGAERSLVRALRKAEMETADAWAAIHSESTEAAKAYHAQASRHSTQLIAVEEAGYERGLADGRADGEPDVFKVPADVLTGAYNGLLVLRTMCRKANLEMGAEKAKEIAGWLAEIDPSLPARSALRSPHNLPEASENE